MFLLVILMKRKYFYLIEYQINFQIELRILNILASNLNAKQCIAVMFG